MEYIKNFIYSASINALSFTLLSLLWDNTIFAKAIGSSTVFFLLRKKYSILLFGAVLTLVTTASAVIVRYVEPLISKFDRVYLYRPLIYVLIISIVYILLIVIFRKRVKNEEKRKYLLTMTHLSAFNCISLGALLLPTQLGNTLLSSYMGYGLGTGIGFTVSAWLIQIANIRLSNENIPKSFKGMPITLIYIGIISLAIYGLIGHESAF